MSGKLDKTLNGVFGCPTESATTQLDFTATVTSGEVGTNQVVRLAASEDCYISFIKPGDNQATSAGCLLFGGIPEVFSTTERETYISVIRKTTSGELVITKLKTRSS